MNKNAPLIQGDGSKMPHKFKVMGQKCPTNSRWWVKNAPAQIQSITAVVIKVKYENA